ncbi:MULTISPECIES: hypothetical protein [unclassified Microbacterium]|uniref:hypothetical protein n=1 Tax=unclassified Microbacterium TaxID=2609290 RepID=UPI0012F853C2|nr:hypothetical protein [Microbacterium sp. MAH-37]MVQ42129.1 hypothetical protein [Microbacterium sp. MAH-37]
MLQRATWRLWPWLNWLLPIGFVLFCLWRLLSFRGETALTLVLASPLIIPAAGLLGSLPRLVLRRAGVRSTPAPRIWLLVLHWWCWPAVAFAMPDMTLTGDPTETPSAPVPSVLQQMVGAPMGGVLSAWALVVAVVVGLGSWVALLVVTAGPAALRHRRAWLRAGWAAAVLAPVLLFGVAAAGVAAGQARWDAAGERPAQATARTADEQIALAEHRYDTVQQVVADLRAVAAPQLWESDAACAEPADATATGLDSYRVIIGFRHQATGDLVVDRDAFVRVLADAGWTITDEREAPMSIEARGPQGAEIRLVADGDMPFRISATAGSWWQSADQPGTSRTCEPGRGAGGGYAADRWPGLG